jgi:hypothetical protein
MTSILGVCGLIGSGKNTVAEYLQEKHGYIPVSFAHVLKDACSSLFGWDREMLEGRTEESRIQREVVDKFWSDRLNIPNFSPRYALQYIGTEVMRNHFHPDIWVFAAERKIMNYDKVVISDVRFPNEIAMLKRNGGNIWRVRRGQDPEWFDVSATWNKKLLGNESGVTLNLIRDIMKHYGVHESEWTWTGFDFDEVLDNEKDLSYLYNLVEDRLKK